MKKRLTVYGLLALFAVGVISFMYFRPGVTRVNYLRIKNGMTRGEITFMLGGPPNRTWQIETFNKGCQEWWSGYGGDITLIYDEHDQIVWKTWEGREAENLLFWLLGQRIRDG